MHRRPPSSPLCPYPTLSRSDHDRDLAAHPACEMAGELLGAAAHDLFMQLGQLAAHGEGAVRRQPFRPRTQGLDQTQRRFEEEDRKSTRLNSSNANISYAVFC